jgi:hypothetical protein
MRAKNQSLLTHLFYPKALPAPSSSRLPSPHRAFAAYSIPLDAPVPNKPTAFLQTLVIRVISHFLRPTPPAPAQNESTALIIQTRLPNWLALGGRWLTECLGIRDDGGRAISKFRSWHGVKKRRRKIRVARGILQLVRGRCIH